MTRYIAWSGLFKRLHVYGWVTKGFGTWLADIAAVSMVVFGISGLILFVNPRLRKRKNRKVRLKSQAATSRAATH